MTATKTPVDWRAWQCPPHGVTNRLAAEWGLHYGLGARSCDERVLEALNTVLESTVSERGYRLRFIDGGTAYTTFADKVIAVTAKPVEHLAGRPGEAFAVLAAMVCHEVGHVWYTQDLMPALEARWPASDPDRNVAFRVSNVLEDVRLERRFVERLPGWKGVFHVALSYLSHETGNRAPGEPTNASEALNVWLAAQRYRRYCQWPSPLGTRTAEAFALADECDAAITDDPAGHVALVERVLGWLYTFPKAPRQPDPDGPGGSTPQPTDGQPDPDGGDEGEGGERRTSNGTCDCGCGCVEALAFATAACCDKCGHEVTQSGQGGSGGQGGDEPTDGPDGGSGGEGGDEGEPGQSGGPQGGGNGPETHDEPGPIVPDEDLPTTLDDLINEGSDAAKRLNARQDDPNRTTYEHQDGSVLEVRDAEVSPYPVRDVVEPHPEGASLVADAFTSTRLSHERLESGFQSGRFRGSSARRAATGSLNVMYRPVGQSKTKLSLHVVIDWSGSMGGYGVRNADRLAQAIGDGLWQVREVRTSIWHYASGYAERVWRTESQRPVRDCLAGTRYSGGGTPTGLALRGISKVADREVGYDERLVYVSITDGAPSDADAVRVFCEEQRAAGNVVLGIYVDRGGADASMVEYMRRQYGEGTVAFDGSWDHLAADIATVVGEALNA